MKALEPLLGIVLGITVLCLSKYFPNVQSTLLTVGGSLLTAGMPSIMSMAGAAREAPPARTASLGKASPAAMFYLAIATLLTLMCLGLGLSGCSHAQVPITTALESCVMSDPANAAAKQATLACIESAATGEAVACLADIPPDVVWTVDEIACVIMVEQGNQTPDAAPAATKRILRRK
jgi:hypothetical protein